MSEIGHWLEGLGLGQLGSTFADAAIDFDVLREISENDLEKLGVPLGHRKRLMKAIAALGETLPPGEPQVLRVGREMTPAAVSVIRPDAERRQLTVMFADLVGSTQLSGKLDPEDMRTVVSNYQNAVAGEITRFEGHVAKFMGDGVLAYFGYPMAHEDDAERAVRAGLRITKVVADLKTPDGIPMSARIGVATGLVVVGDLIGEGAAQEQAVVGETPNFAARLQVLAEPGSVVIGQATRRLVGGLFELTDLGPQRLKGFAEPLAAFRVVGEGRAEGRFEALHGRGLTPLVGRENELAMLLDRWAWAKDGHGQVVLIAGVSGIGKSRLLRALREQLADEPHIALSHFCSPYHTNTALHPVITQLERAAGFAADEASGDKLAKLEALLGQATERLDEAAPLIAALLSLPVGDRYPPLNLSPQRQKQRTLEALIEQLAGLARDRPVLELYEDLHWTDPSTLQLLDLLVERVSALHALVVLTYRPEFNPPWTGQSHVTVLTMNRLGRRQSAAMVDRIAGGKALPAEVLDQILAKTDGVPLFVEELTKTVLESGLLADVGDRYELAGQLPPLAIPATLHDSLMARLDRLAPIKDLAQTAAVIGRDFTQELLAAVSPLSEADLAAALDQLVSSELVFRRGTPPAATYSFKHALVQDVAYNSLLKGKRRDRHTRIAQVLEDRFPDAAPEILAHHCDQAGLTERAVVYWRRAGTRALERSAVNEAIAHLNHGLASLANLPAGPRRDDMELDIQIGLAAARTAARGYAAEETERAHMRAHELLRADDPRQFAVLNGLFVARWNWAQLQDAAAVAAEMVRRAQRQRNPVALCVAHRSAAVAQNVLGEFCAARRNALMAWDSYNPRAHAQSALEYGHDIGVAALMHVAVADWFLGFPERAQRSAQQGVTLAEELGHANTRGYAQFWQCWLHMLAREGPALAARAEALVRFADEQFLSFWSTIGRTLAGTAEVLQGNSRRGIELLDSGIMDLARARSQLLVHFAKGARAEALVHLGHLEEGLALLEQTLDFGRAAELRWSEAEHHRLHGALSLRKTPPDREVAEASFRSAIDVARAQEAKVLELRAATSLARLWMDQGRCDEVRDLVAPVYDWFSEGFDTTDLKDAKSLLDDLR